VTELAITDERRAFFTEASLAEYLAVSDRTVRDWIRSGKLASYKLGKSRRIDPADVDAFLAAHRQNGQAA
jgi:excisionase family DNA binding protein